MPISIFKSLFWLNFKNEQLESTFPLSIEHGILLSNKITYSIFTIISVFCLTLLIGLDIKYDLHNQKMNDQSLYFFTLLFIAIGLIILGIITMLLIFNKQKSTKLQAILAISAYISFILFSLYIKIILETMVDFPHDLIYLFSVMEYFLRIIWHLCSLVQFSQTFIINIIFPPCILAMFFSLDSINSLITDNGISYILLNIGIIMTSYFITKTIKKKYYLQEQGKGITKKHENILNFLNTGYMQVKMGKIICMNTSLYKTLNMTKNIQDHPFQQENEISIDSEPIFNVLFSGSISYSHEEYIQNEEVILTHNSSNSNSNSNREGYGALFLHFRHLWENRIIEEGKEDSFIFLAYKTIELNVPNKDSYITYEIRFKYNFDEFEFIFNDITRTKDFEKKEYDWKIKNVFLTKIAHEFKNPLLSIKELMDQIKELLNNDKQKWEYQLNDKDKENLQLLREKCFDVQSFADYLLLLIKDLDYFSANNNAFGNSNDFRDSTSSNAPNNLITPTVNNMYNNSIPNGHNNNNNGNGNFNGSNSCNISVEKVELNKLVSFCTGIAKTKLVELNKHEIIAYDTIIQSDVPKVIYTDCIKLKQILINLISNAIKFTKKGKISLEIIKCSSIENHITFYVKDTGIGFTNKMKNSISNSFGYKSSSLSDYAHIGIGIAIIKDLTNRIGTEIQFKSETNIGSQFWFSIPINSSSYKVTKNNVSLLSDCNTLPQSLPKHYRNNPSVSNEIDLPICSHHKMIESVSSFDENINDFSGVTEKIKTMILQTSPLRTILDSLEENKKERKTIMKIIVADDEVLVRKAQIRIITDEAKKMNIELNIIEVNDGLEVLNALYATQGEGIDGIISDQKMKFINGASCFKILTKDTNYAINIPFFIVTAYNSSASYFKGINCEGIYTKPLRKCDVDILLNILLVNKE